MVTRVEAVLYLKGRPISKKNLSEITNADINSINKALRELKEKYSNTKSAIELNEIKEKYIDLSKKYQSSKEKSTIPLK